MASVETEFHNYLLTKTAITDIVSTRVWHHHAPQGTALPCVTWNQTNKLHDHMITGAAGRAVADFEVTAWSYTFTECQTLSEAIRTSLHGYHGSMGAYTIYYITYETEYVQADPPANGADNPYKYQIVSSFNVGYHESIPF